MVKVDWTSLDDASAVVRAVIGSKPACCLDAADSELVVSLVLRMFLATIPPAHAHGQRVRLGSLYAHACIPVL